MRWAAVPVGIIFALLWILSADRGQGGGSTPSPLIERAIEMGYVPCQHEYSPGPCFWDAQRQGNGEGESFVITDDGEVFR